MSRLPADTVGGRSSKLNLGVEGGGRPPVILATAGSHRERTRLERSVGRKRFRRVVAHYARLTANRLAMV
jgi:hypothetical protein